MKKIFIIVVLIHIGFVGKNIVKSLLKIDRLKIEREEKKERIEKLKESISICENDIKNIKMPFYREKIARERLQMILTGEKLYRVVEEKNT